MSGDLQERLIPALLAMCLTLQGTAAAQAEPTASRYGEYNPVVLLSPSDLEIRFAPEKLTDEFLIRRATDLVKNDQSHLLQVRKGEEILSMMHEQLRRAVNAPMRQAVQHRIREQEEKIALARSRMVFTPDQVEDRQPEFAARALKEELKERIVARAAVSETKFAAQFLVPLGAIAYDFDRSRIHYTGSMMVDIDQRAHYFADLYKLGGEHADSTTPYYSYRFPYHGADAREVELSLPIERQRLLSRSGGLVVAMNEKLEIPALELSPAEAERVLAAPSRADQNAMMKAGTYQPGVLIRIEAEITGLAPNSGQLFARLDGVSVIGPYMSTLAAYSPDDFDKATVLVAKNKQAAEAAAQAAEMAAAEAAASFNRSVAALSETAQTRRTSCAQMDPSEDKIECFDELRRVLCVVREGPNKERNLQTCIRSERPIGNAALQSALNKDKQEVRQALRDKRQADRERAQNEEVAEARARMRSRKIEGDSEMFCNRKHASLMTSPLLDKTPAYVKAFDACISSQNSKQTSCLERNPYESHGTDRPYGNDQHAELIAACTFQ